jgi:putative membrane protein insertion efficiency factor
VNVDEGAKRRSTRTLGRARSGIWLAGWPLRGALLLAIKLYRVLLSGWLGGQCRFYPSCSAYAEEAIRERGAIVGTALAVWRVARCGPFTPGGVDPVPWRRTTWKEPETVALQVEPRTAG